MQSQLNSLQMKSGITLVFITLLLDTIGVAMVAPILPSLLQELTGSGIRDAAIAGSLLVVAYALMQFLFAPLVGVMSDRFGRRPILLISVFTLGLDNLLCAIAPTYWLLLLARALSGLSGSSFTTCLAYISDISNSQNRVRNFSIIETAFGVGFIVGPLLGGFMGSYDIRLPFYAAAFLAFINFACSWFLLPETLAKENRRQVNWYRANPIASFFNLRKYHNVLALALVDFFYFTSLYIWISQWPYLSTLRYGWDKLDISISYTIFSIGQLVIMLLVLPRFVKRFPEKKLLLLGLVMLAASHLGYAFSIHAWMVYVVFVITSFEFFISPSLRSLIASQVEPQFQGEVQGGVASLRSLTAIVSPVVYAFVFRAFTNPESSVQFVGAPFLLAFIFAMISLGIYLYFAYWNHSKTPS